MLMLFISPSSGQSVPSSNIVSRTVLSSDGTWKTVHRVYDNGLGDVVQEVVSYPGPSLSSIICGDGKRYWEYGDEKERFPIYLLFEKNGKWLPFEQDEKGNVKQHIIPCYRYKESWSVLKIPYYLCGSHEEDMLFKVTLIHVS